LSFEVIQTPGHSPGSICLYWPDKKILFTGDVVFNQGIGRTDLPGGNGKELKESIKKISRLDAEYLLPGHGDIVSGREAVKTNFANIERDWFHYLY
jgi:hydroxyacylglutathione hydrolase